MPSYVAVKREAVYEQVPRPEKWQYQDTINGDRHQRNSRRAAANPQNGKPGNSHLRRFPGSSGMALRHRNQRCSLCLFHNLEYQGWPQHGKRLLKYQFTSPAEDALCSSILTTTANPRGPAPRLL